MSFIWSRKFVKPVEVQPQTELETIQVITIQEYDKISVEEHKDGECLVSTLKEDGKTDEGQGHVCQGEGMGSSDQGGKEDVARCEEQQQDHESQEESPQPLTEESATE
jgi:hypothetical protein